MTPAPRTWALLLGVLALGQAIHDRNPSFTPLAFGWLALSLGAVVFFLVGSAEDVQRAPRTLGLLAGGLLLQLVQLAIWFPPIIPGLAAVALVAGALWLPQEKAVRYAGLGLLGLYVAVGAFVIRQMPSPHMDVFVFQRDSALALLRGQNPYTLTFPNIYGNTNVYAPGTANAERVFFGFPYPPLSLFLSTLGQALGGDIRWTPLAATALSGFLLMQLSPGRMGVLLAAAFLFTPRGLFVLSQGWTEPLIVSLLMLTTWSALRFPRVLPLALGGLLASKQYMVLAVPFIPWLLGEPRRTLRLMVQAGLWALVLTLPLALWSWTAFFDSVVKLQFAQPFRFDALSFPAALARLTGQPGSAWPALLAVLVAGALAWKRCPRTPLGFALAIGGVLLAFFAFNKQAFTNYYFLVIGALTLASALAVESPVPGTRAPR